MAVEDARTVFDMGNALGFDFSVLDVGGGFPGTEAARITVHEVSTSLVLLVLVLELILMVTNLFVHSIIGFALVTDYMPSLLSATFDHSLPV